MTKEQRSRLKWWWRAPLIWRLFAIVCLVMFPIVVTIALWCDNWEDAKYSAGALLDIVEPNSKGNVK